MNSNALTKAFASYVAKIIYILLTPLTFILIVKPLTVDEYGLYSLINTFIPLCVMIFGLGLHRYNYKYIPGRDEAKQKFVLKNSLAIILIIYFMIGIVIIFLTSKHVLSVDFRLSIEIVLYLLLLLINTELLRYLGLNKRISEKVFLSLTQDKFWLLILLVASFYFSYNIKFIFFCRILLSITVIIILSIRIKIVDVFKSKLDRQQITESLKFSLPLIIYDLSLYVIDASDKFIIGILTNNMEVGYYSFTYNWLRLIYSLTVIMVVVLQPYISESHYKNELINESKYVIIIIKFVSIIYFGAIVFLVSYYTEIVLLFSKSEYLITYNYLLILSPFPFFMTLSYLFTSIVVLENKGKKLTMIIVLIALLNIILNYILISYIGTIGATISTTLSYFIFFISSLTIIKINKKISKNNLISILKIGIYAFTLFSFNTYLVKSIRTNIFFSFIIYIIMMFFLVYILKIFRKEEFQLLRN